MAVDPNTLWGATPTPQSYNTQTGVTTTGSVNPPGTTGAQPTVAPTQSATPPKDVATPIVPNTPVSTTALTGDALGAANQRAVSGTSTPTTPAPTAPQPSIKSGANGSTNFTDSQGRTQTGTVVKNPDGTYSVTDEQGNTRIATPKNDTERQMLEQGATNKSQYDASKLLDTNSTNAKNAVDAAGKALNQGLSTAQDENAQLKKSEIAQQNASEQAIGTELGRKQTEDTTAAGLSQKQADAQFQQSRDSLNNTILRVQNNVRLLKGQGDTLFGGAATSSAYVEGLAQTINESTSLLSDLHDMGKQSATSYGVQNQQRANQLASQIQDITDQINKSVSMENQNQLVALGKLQAAGSATTPEAIEKFQTDAIKSLQDVYNEQVTSKIPELQNNLKITQGLYSDAQGQLKVDPNTTKQMNDGYLYNANGTRMTDSNGGFLQMNVPGDIVGQPQQGPDGNMYAMIRNPVTGAMSTTQISGSNKSIPIDDKTKTDYATAIANGQKVDISKLSPNDQMDVQTRAIQQSNQTTTQPLTSDVVTGLATAISNGDPNATQMLSRLTPAQYSQVMQGYATMTHSPTVSQYNDTLKTNPDGTQTVVRQGYDKFGNAAGPAIDIPKKVLNTFQNAVDSKTGETGTMVQYDDGTSQFINASKPLIHATVKNADGTTSEVVHDPNSGTSYTIPGGGGNATNTTGGHDLSQSPQAISGTARPAFANNNPGNITDTSWGGTAGGMNGFTKFDTVEQGIQALLSKIDYNKANGVNGVDNGSSYNGNMTLAQYFAKYAPSSDGNDPQAYARSVATAAGATVDTPIKDVDTQDMAIAIMQHENRPMMKQLASMGIITPEGINMNATNPQNQTIPYDPPLKDDGNPNTDAPGYNTNLIKGLNNTTQASLDMQTANYATQGASALAKGVSAGAMAINQAIKQRFTTMYPGETPGDIANSGKALSKSLGVQQTYLDSTKRAFNTAIGGLDILDKTIKQYNLNTSDYSDLNHFENALSAHGADVGQIGALKLALTSVQTEYGQVLSRGGQTTDKVRGEAEDLLSGNMGGKNLKEIVDTMKSDGKNVVDEAQKTVDDLKKQYKDLSTGGNKNNASASTSSAPASTTSTTSAGSTINNSMSAEDLAKAFAPKP